MMLDIKTVYLGKDFLKYFPFDIFSITNFIVLLFFSVVFIFVLFSNLIGVIFYSFAVTSHPIVISSLSFFSFNTFRRF